MIKFELFARLYREAAEYSDADMFVAERGWQSDWMDEIDAAGINVGMLLINVWELAHMDIAQLRRRTGLTQRAFADRYSMPRRSVENWESLDNRHEPAGYLKMLIAYTLIEV